MHINAHQCTSGNGRTGNWLINMNRTSYQDAFLGPENAGSHIPEDPIGADHLIQYSHDAPQVLAPNVACLGYSVAAPGGGKLVAYRWDGEQRLDNGKFVFVEKGPE
jgi:hypothetical protein